MLAPMQMRMHRIMYIFEICAFVCHVDTGGWPECDKIRLEHLVWQRVSNT